MRGPCYLGLLLAVLANLGLSIHSGHHTIGERYAGVTSHWLAGHSEPDSTLHLEGASEVRTLACPGCLLQQQIGGSYLPALRDFDRPAPAAIQWSEPSALLDWRIPSSRITRGPPSC